MEKNRVQLRAGRDRPLGRVEYKASCSVGRSSHTTRRPRKCSWNSDSAWNSDSGWNLIRARPMRSGAVEAPIIFAPSVLNTGNLWACFFVRFETGLLQFGGPRVEKNVFFSTFFWLWRGPCFFHFGTFLFTLGSFFPALEQIFLHCNPSPLPRMVIHGPSPAALGRTSYLIPLVADPGQ